MIDVGRPVWEMPEERAKARGQARAESANYRNVQLARMMAKELAGDGRAICADDVRASMLEHFPDTVFGNWMGSVFKGPEWVAVGFTKSKTPGSHANLLRTWRLK